MPSSLLLYRLPGRRSADGGILLSLLVQPELGNSKQSGGSVGIKDDSCLKNLKLLVLFETYTFVDQVFG